MKTTKLYIDRKLTCTSCPPKQIKRRQRTSPPFIIFKCWSLWNYTMGRDIILVSSRTRSHNSTVPSFSRRKHCNCHFKNLTARQKKKIIIDCNPSKREMNCYNLGRDQNNGNVISVHTKQAVCNYCIEKKKNERKQMPTLLDIRRCTMRSDLRPGLRSRLSHKSQNQSTGLCLGKKCFLSVSGI